MVTFYFSADKFNEKEKTKLENSKQQIKNAIQSVKDKI